MSSNAGVECYNVLISLQSTQDKEAGMYSFFNVIENLGVPKSSLGKPVPLEVNSFWMFSEDVIGQTREVRVQAVAVSDNSTTYSSPPGQVEVPGATVGDSKLRRARVKQQGFMVPAVAGDYKIRITWRLVGTEEWTTTDTYWPLVVVASESEPVLPAPAA